MAGENGSEIWDTFSSMAGEASSGRRWHSKPDWRELEGVMARVAVDFLERELARRSCTSVDAASGSAGASMDDSACARQGTGRRANGRKREGPGGEGEREGRCAGAGGRQGEADAIWRK
jgi:hypothetical protein